MLMFTSNKLLNVWDQLDSIDVLVSCLNYIMSCMCARAQAYLIALATCNKAIANGHHDKCHVCSNMFIYCLRPWQFDWNFDHHYLSMCVLSLIYCVLLLLLLRLFSIQAI